MLDITVAQAFIWFTVLLFSLTVHESAHAWTPDRAADQGADHRMGEAGAGQRSAVASPSARLCAGRGGGAGEQSRAGRPCGRTAGGLTHLAGDTRRAQLVGTGGVAIE